MINYKCPYCGQDSYAKSSKKKGKFDNWISVRNHTIKCLKNNKTYTFCSYYGPISLDVINSYPSVNHFKKDYPNLSFSAWAFRSLRLAGKTTLREVIWTKEFCVAKIQQFHSIFGRVPQHRELDELTPEYPSRSTLVRLFGSYNKAIESSGYISNDQNGFGRNTHGKDNILYDSAVEAYFVDKYLYGKYTYDYYTPYGNGWYFDFYIKELDLYIEIDGGFNDSISMYRTKMLNKIEFCKNHNLKLRVINHLDVYLHNFKI